jgi:hypothetical protein
MNSANLISTRQPCKAGSPFWAGDQPVAIQTRTENPQPIENTGDAVARQGYSLRLGIPLLSTVMDTKGKYGPSSQSSTEEVKNNSRQEIIRQMLAVVCPRKLGRTLSTVGITSQVLPSRRAFHQRLLGQESRAAMKTIPLTKGKVALVDDEDFAWLNRFKWYAKLCGTRWEAVREFSFVNSSGETVQYQISMATFLMGTKLSLVPEHKNRNSLDNRRENLRWASRSFNAVNWWRKNKHGRGVVKHREGGFHAAIKKSIADKQKTHLGMFATAQEARDAYDDAAIKYHGEFAMLNRDHFKPKEV